jgi:two-component system, OmpR family, sensor kinase
MPIRLRLALAFALAAAALFALGGWLFASGLSSAQLKTIDSQLTAQLAQTGGSLPAGGYLTQVIDPAGRVRSASADAGNVALVIAGQLSQARRGRIFVTRTMDEESTRIAAAPLVGRPGWVTIAAGSLETYDATQSQVARELAVGGAVFTAVAGLGAYWLARAALSPVERLRRQVAAISERGGAPGAGVAAVEVPATRDEVAALAGTMNDLLGRLQRALARQRAFAADAGHELRNPLAVLRGELELAARPGRGLPELTAAVRSAGAEAERLSRLTDDLLLLASSDEDRLSLRLERTDIGALLASSAGLAGSRLAAAGLSCRVDVPPGTCADVDADRIRQAVDNPARQRAAVRSPRLGHRPRGAGRRSRPGHRGIRRRAGFPGRLPAARVRALRPPGQRPVARRRRGRPGPGHRPGHRCRARRGRGSGQQAGRGSRGQAAPSGCRRPP